MRKFTAFLIAGTLAISSAAGLLAQSSPPPRILVVMPPGGKAGSTIELTVSGADLENVEGLAFSFPGAKVEVLAAEKAPPTDNKKGGGGKGQANRADALQKFKVILPASAPPGTHDLRVVSKGGISNSRSFVIGDLNEVVDKEPNDDTPQAQRIDLNTTVSGVIATPTDVDYFVFSGKKGQRVVASCMTTSIDSRLPAELKILQIDKGNGIQLAFSRNYWYNDAVTDAVLPADGDYFVRLSSFTYTLGGPDYFYRLTVSTTPWIDAVYPPVVEPGKDAKVTVFGRNLPGGVLDPQTVVDERPLEKLSVSVKAPGDATAGQRLAYRGFVSPTSALLDGFEHRLKSPAGSSNPVLLGLAKAPVVLDNEANDTLEKPQQVPMPCEIAGRVEKKSDRDCYQFSAKNGQVVSIEVFADRLGSALDMQFALYNEKGDKLTDQDDTPDTLAPQFFNRTDDPLRYRRAITADGKYTLVVASKEAFTIYGPRYLYTVRITTEEPDYRVVAMPASNFQIDSVVLGQAGHQAFTVFVQRTGSFTGDVTITGDKLPPGVTMKPQVIAGNQKQSAVVLSAAPEAPPYAGSMQLVATATIGEKKLSREVRAASITWSIAQQQQQTPTISRLDRELAIAVRDKAPYSLSPGKDKIAVPQGDRISIPLKVTAIAPDFKTSVQVTALALPTGMALAPVTVTPGKDATINLDSKTTVLPGNYTVVLRGQTAPVQPNQQPKPGGPRNLIQTAPPIFVTIVPKQLAKVSVPQNNPKLKAGGSLEVPIRVARQFDYEGPFKIEVDTKAAKGITAGAAAIKAGQDEATLKLTAEPGSQAGGNASITVRVIAMFNNEVPVVHEAKFTVAVTK